MVNPDFGRRIAEELTCLRRYARALLRRPDRVDDLVQDTVLRALSKAHLWQPGTDLRAWLLTLMHNQHLNLQRKAGREDGHSPLEDAYDVSRPAPQPDTLLLRDFQRALDRLPDEQRTVVLMIGLGDACYEEVATVLNIPLNTMRSRLVRARATMRALMEAPERRKTHPLRPLAVAASKRCVRGRRDDHRTRPEEPSRPVRARPQPSLGRLSASPHTGRYEPAESRRLEGEAVLSAAARRRSPPALRMRAGSRAVHRT
jgi:RNA polymerase sigma-70 factor (ECF subfamily)